MRNRINACLALFRPVDGDVVHNAFLCFVNGNGTGDFRKNRHLLRAACFKKFLNTRETLRDIITCNTAGVEGTHRKLCTGFTDGLCCDNTDSFTCICRQPCCKVNAIAACAHADACLACQNGTDKHFMDSVRFQNRCILRHQHMLRVIQDFTCSRICNRSSREASSDCRAKIFHHLAAVINRCCPDAVSSLAVHLTDNNILADVDHTTRQITGVCRTECRVRHTLSCTSGGNEIFQNRKAFTEVGLDRDFNRFTGCVCHQASHTGELTDLVHRTTGTGVCHHVNRVVLVKDI